MTEAKKNRAVHKAATLLGKHETPLIKELGSKAFELLTPKQAAEEMDVPVERLGDLIRQGWLASVPNLNAGPANLYYRWRVEFVKRYRTTHKKERSA